MGVGAAGFITCASARAILMMVTGGTGAITLSKWCRALIMAKMNLFFALKSGSDDRGALGALGGPRSFSYLRFDVSPALETFCRRRRSPSFGGRFRWSWTRRGVGW